MDKKDTVCLNVERNSNPIDMEVNNIPDNYKNIEISKEEGLALLKALENFDKLEDK